MHVKPKIYLAAGISGAPEHVEGMKDAEIVISINTDPNAPIFNVSDYGVVSDMFDIIGPLKDELSGRIG
jgi:electron transfer flavoprotein alpha subunit